MKSRRRNASEDRQTIRRRQSQVNPEEFSTKIPTELVIDIFSRLPLKSIAICRCVSKQWASILRRSDFTDLFFRKSLTRPQLLFVGQKRKEALFRSSPQSQNPDDYLSSSSDLVLSLPFERISKVSPPINGLLCVSDDRILKRRKTAVKVWVICNPSTGQSFPLPRMNTRNRTNMRSFLGYDPVEKQHKVLAMTWGRHERAGEHQVLTLGGTEKLAWRMSECGIQHSSWFGNSICIDGVLYYITNNSRKEDIVIIVCFDVRTEKYSFVKVMEPVIKSMHPEAALVNFKGKLATVRSQTEHYRISGKSTSFEMWVLEDPERHEWSNHVYKLPPMWKHVVSETILYIAGLTGTNEIVLSPLSSSDVGHVFYYNFERETIRRVKIQGMGALRGVFRVYTFLNHLEDVTLMNLF